MRKMTVALVAFAALFPVAALAHGGTEVTVEGDVRPGGPIEIEGGEFKPGDVVRIELRKDGVEPVELGRVPVDDEGGFIATLHVPADVRPGIYQLAADGEESATFDVTVLEPSEGSTGSEAEETSTRSVSNDRPAGETVGLAVFTAVIGLAAVGLLWISRTRPRSAGV